MMNVVDGHAVRRRTEHQVNTSHSLLGIICFAEFRSTCLPTIINRYTSMEGTSVLLCRPVVCLSVFCVLLINVEYSMWKKPLLIYFKWFEPTVLFATNTNRRQLSVEGETFFFRWTNEWEKKRRMFLISIWCSVCSVSASVRVERSRKSTNNFYIKLRRSFGSRLTISSFGLAWSI